MTYQETINYLTAIIDKIKEKGFEQVVEEAEMELINEEME